LHDGGRRRVHARREHPRRVLDGGVGGVSLGRGDGTRAEDAGCRTRARRCSELHGPGLDNARPG
jgi:hypothetical protein